MSDGEHVFGPMVNVPYPVRPDICRYCRKDKLLPVEWHNIPYNSWAIQCRCAECEREYCAVMSQRQAEIWDELLARQFREIEDAIG